MQKIIHLSLVVAILLASTGFQVRISHCSGEKGSSSINFFSDPTCCCGKSENSPGKSCNDMPCIIQGGIVSTNNFNSSIQQATKFVKEPVSYPSFNESIRPALLETIPHFTLPPPVSGRFIGILHQTFII